MNYRFSTLRPASWLGRIQGMFNLNDQRWGRGDEPSSGQDESSPPTEDPGSSAPNRPQQPLRGAGGGGGGGGRGPNQGPPDLDELWRDFNRKLSGLFGGKGGGGAGGAGGRGGGNNYQPDMKSAGLGVGVIGGIAVLIWLGTGFFIVQEGQQAVITQFGKYHATVGAGFNWRLPYPVQRHETVRVTQIRSVDVGRDSIIKSTGLRESAMLTEDENIVEIKFAVQYRLNDARAYLFESRSPDEAVVQAAESAVREVVGKIKLDSALAEERDQIAPRVRDLMQVILDRYKVGIEVVAVNMQQGGVRPPEQVQAAFDDVLKAGQERERVKNEAQAYANDVVPRAIGTAARLTQEAEAYKARIVAQAEGDSQRFTSVLAEYQKAPQVTRNRLYLDTMQQIYSGVNKVLIDSRSGGNLMYLPLDKIMQSAGAPASADATSSPANSSPAAPAAVPPATDARSRDAARSRERESR